MELRAVEGLRRRSRTILQRAGGWSQRTGGGKVVPLNESLLSPKRHLRSQTFGNLVLFRLARSVELERRTPAQAFNTNSGTTLVPKPLMWIP